MAVFDKLVTRQIENMTALDKLKKRFLPERPTRPETELERMFPQFKGEPERKPRNPFRDTIDFPDVTQFQPEVPVVSGRVTPTIPSLTPLPEEPEVGFGENPIYWLSKRNLLPEFMFSNLSAQRAIRRGEQGLPTEEPTGLERQAATIRQQELANDPNPIIRMANTPTVVGGLTPGQMAGIAAIGYGLWQVGGSVVRNLTQLRRLPEYKAMVQFAKENNIPRDSKVFRDSEAALRSAINLNRGGAKEAADEIMAQFYKTYTKAMPAARPTVTPPQVARFAPAIVPRGTQTGALAFGGKPRPVPPEGLPIVPREPVAVGGIVPGVVPTEPPIAPPITPPVAPVVTPEVPIRLVAEAPPVEPPPPITPPTEIVPEPDPVGELTALIKSARPVRAETELLKHEELRRRAGALAGAIKAGEGEKAFLRGKGVLKGELPQAEFEPPRPLMSSESITGLFNKIRDSELPPFQKLNTSEALSAILGGKLPTRGDIALLEDMFGSELASALLSKRPWTQKAWDIFLEAWNIPRTLMASGELSGSLRQGAFVLPSHPKVWGRSMWAQLRATVSEENAQAIDRQIQTNPGAEERAQYKVFHAPISGVGSKLTEREEVFISNFFDRFVNWWEGQGLVKKVGTSPLYPIAKGVRISERAYITFLNKLRAEIFDTTAAAWRKTGVEPTPQELTRLANFANNWTGRGTLGKLEDAAPILSGGLFSPRLQASRIGIFWDAMKDTVIVANDIIHGRPPNRVARENLKAVASFVGTGLMVLGLAKLNGAEVSTDPNSADFGKIKMGKTRLDIWGSFQPYARFISNMITGMRTSTITGETKEVSRGDIVKNFVRSKLMPTVGFVYDVLEGRTFKGEDIELNVEQAYERLAPMFWQDMAEAVESEGLVGGFKALPGFLGVGVMTYDLPSWPELEEYFNIKEDTVIGGEVVQTAAAKRTEYRINNPENEAKLFILGRFTTLKTPTARKFVLQIMEEHKIDPKDVRGYENVFGQPSVPTPETRGGRNPFR